jgi:tetratricopeptide (TPR) repeat protein
VLAASLTACGWLTSEQELLTRANAARSSGDNAAAVEDLKRVLRRNPRNVPARLALGEINLLAGDFEAAISELKAARRNGATDSRSTEMLANAYLVVRRPEETLQVIAEQRGPESASMLAVKGAALIQLQRLPEARDAFDRALSIDEKNFRALYGLTMVVARLEGLDAALAVSERALKVAPGDALAHLLRGGLLLRASSFDPAMEQFEAALRATVRSKRPEQYFSALAGMAEVLFAQRKVQEGLAVTQRLQQVAPEHPRSRYLRARALVLAGKPDEARPLLEKNVGADPGALESKLLLGLVALQTGMVAQAEMYLASVVGVQPGNERARRALEEARRQRGRQALAQELRRASEAGDKAAEMRAYESLLEADPNDAVALNNLAWLKYQARSPGALQLAKRAHELAPRDARITDTYAWLLVESGKVREGLALLEPIAGASADEEVKLHYAQARARAEKLE